VAPRGSCLGMFLPIGLGRVGRLSAYPREYISPGAGPSTVRVGGGVGAGDHPGHDVRLPIVFVIAFALYLVALGGASGTGARYPLPQDDAGQPPAAEESPATLAVGNREGVSGSFLSKSPANLVHIVAGITVSP